MKAIIWDIGGVLLTDPQYIDFWQDKGRELRTAFGDGSISIEEMVRQGSKLLGITEEDFLSGYRKAYCNVERMETIDLFNRVRVDKYILSDTNPIHGPHIKEVGADIFSEAKAVFLSYETGLRKNSTENFIKVLEKVGLPGDEVLFIDNKEKIIDRAKEAGLQTHHYTSYEELEKELQSLGVL